MRLRLRAAAASLALLIAGCVNQDASFQRAPSWPHAELLLLGEQHDAPAHQQREAEVVRTLAARARLAAVALEMAEQGRDTRGLPRDASEAQTREALAWDERGWPWAAYGPAVMNAVRVGVPVFGANLPRTALRETMRDAAIDTHVSDAVRAQLQADVREGHCDLLPASQLPAMTRVQIGRDRAMAQTLGRLTEAGRVVLLIAGSNHVDASRGVPLHLHALAPATRWLTVRLAAGAAKDERTPGFDETWPTPAVPPTDHCAELAGQLGPAR